MRKRNVTITIRCTEDERQRIYNKARQHSLTLSDFVLRSALDKKIIVAEGINEIVKQQKASCTERRIINRCSCCGNRTSVGKA